MESNYKVSLQNDYNSPKKINTDLKSCKMHKLPPKLRVLSPSKNFAKYHVTVNHTINYTILQNSLKNAKYILPFLSIKSDLSMSLSLLAVTVFAFVTSAHLCNLIMCCL